MTRFPFFHKKIHLEVSGAALGGEKLYRPDWTVSVQYPMGGEFWRFIKPQKYIDKFLSICISGSFLEKCRNEVFLFFVYNFKRVFTR